MIDGPTYDKDDYALAGEYALDLLSDDERAAFEERLAHEPELRLVVARWEESFTPMTDDVVGVEPPPHVWHGIDARLFATEGKPFWAKLGVWQALSAAATAVAVALAVILLIDGEPVATGQTLVSEIEAGDEAFKIVAVMRAGADSLRISRISGQVPEGRVLELWLIEGEAAPVSLGVLPDSDRSVVPIPAELRPRLAGAILAVTDEPPGGAPEGIPTGNVLGIGTVSAL